MGSGRNVKSRLGLHQEPGTQFKVYLFSLITVDLYSIHKPKFSCIYPKCIITTFNIHKFMRCHPKTDSKVSESLCSNVIYIQISL